MAEITKVTQGYCDFCGEAVLTGECEDQDKADAIATERCNCPEAKEAAAATREEQDQVSKREKTLNDAQADIEDLFGGAAEERGETCIIPEIRDLMYKLAVHVYDQDLRSVNIGVDQGLKAKISVTDKGKLTIQRDDNFTRKREHK